MNNKVSVIVPVYNTEKYLPACIESLINQTYTNLEIILINDGSKDNTAKLMKQLAEKNKHIKFIMLLIIFGCYSRTQLYAIYIIIK